MAGEAGALVPETGRAVLQETSRQALVHLTAVGSSTAAGTAVLRFAGERLLEVRLEVAGLAPDSRHPADIRFGTCAGGGPMAYPLADLVAGPDGLARSRSEVPGVCVIPPSGWFVQVYAGPTFAGAGAAAVACGDVALVAPLFAPGATLLTGPVRTVLAMEGGSSANGTGELAFTGAEELTVTLRLNSLAPDSVHPAHIHFGTCAGGGPIAHYLRDAVADAAGDALSITTVTGIPVIPPLGWYLNVHRGPTLADGGGTAITCGDVTPGAPVIPTVGA